MGEHRLRNHVIELSIYIIKFQIPRGILDQGCLFLGKTFFFDQIS